MNHNIIDKLNKERNPWHFSLESCMQNLIKINLNVLKPQDVSPTLSYDLDTCQDVWRAKNKKDKDSQLKFMQREYHNSFSNFSEQNVDNRLMQKKMKIFNTLF